MSDAVLHVQHVSHRYGDRQALRDVSLSIPAGRLAALLGPNGSGKTTLFRAISTLLRPSQGTVYVCRHDAATDPDAVRRSIGIIFQHVALDADLTVRENLRHHAALHGLSRAEIRAREDDALRILGLGERVNERVKTLSGGLARRADLARVLLHRPRLLLLDEPTAGLDPAARRDFWRAVEWLRTTHGTAVLVATHLLEEAEMCEHVSIMSRGRMVAEGSPDALKADLGHETLWLESEDAPELADRIQVQFGLQPRVLGTSVQISDPQAHNLLAAIYEALPERIVSATVRRPTLEDVYLVHTGKGLHEEIDLGESLEAEQQ